MRVLEFIKPRIRNWSLDLIFGVPGQTIDQWQEDMKRAMALEPMHLATYGLTFEKGTRLWKQRERGEVTPLEEESECQLYLSAMETLEQAGFEHYEISNFAKPGQRCRHNQVYWANHAYLGFGMGAARYVDGVRELNTRDLQTYIHRLQKGESPTFQSECLPPRERAVETIVVQLRRAGGVNRTDFELQTGFSLDALIGPKIEEMIDLQLLCEDQTSVRLTRRGKCVADAVIEQLIRFAS